MREGFHPDYHDERFFDAEEDDKFEHGTGEPGGDPGREGPRGRLARISDALRGVNPLLAGSALAVALVAVFAYGWFTAAPSEDAVQRPPPPSFDRPLFATVDIPVPAPAGWPDLPVTVERPDFMWRSLANSGIAVRLLGNAVTPEVPAPAGWPALPLDGTATHVPLDRLHLRAMRTPAFEPIAEVPSVGTMATAYEPIRGTARPMDALGKLLGAPTGSLKVTAKEWEGPRDLPLALFTIEPDGTVGDAMPATLEWLWLAAIAASAWAAGAFVSWMATHGEEPWSSWEGYESGTGRRAGGLACFAIVALFVERTGSPLYLSMLVVTILTFSAGRGTRARWMTLALGLSAAWLGLTTPVIEPIEALGAEYGSLGVRAWDMLSLGAAAIVLVLATAFPRRLAGTTVTVRERPAPLVQDVRIVNPR